MSLNLYSQPTKQDYVSAKHPYLISPFLYAKRININAIYQHFMSGQ